MKKLKNFLHDLAKRHHSIRQLRSYYLNLQRLWYRLRYRLVVVDDKMVIFESYMGRSYSCSPKALYLEMLNNPKYKDYKFVWAFKVTNNYPFLENNTNTYLVEYGSRQYYKTYATAKYWFSNSRLPYKIWPKKSQKYVQCWHGTPLKKLGFDIIDNNDHAKYTKKELAAQYLEEAKRFTYLLSPSAYATKCFESAFNLKSLGKEDSILELGYPRNDFLYSYKKTDISRVKKQLKIPNNKKIILYAPTWRDNQHSSTTGYTHKNELDLDLMQKELGDEWVILYRAHYFISNSLDFSKYDGFVYDVSKFDDINELYVISDVLITDYSSVMFDYAILQRPMIFFMPDLEYYQNNIRGFYINLNKLPGQIVNNEKLLINILKSLNKYQEIVNNKYITFNKEYNYLHTNQLLSKQFNVIFNDDK